MMSRMTLSHVLTGLPLPERFSAAVQTRGQLMPAAGRDHRTIAVSHLAPTCWSSPARDGAASLCGHDRLGAAL